MFYYVLLFSHIFWFYRWLSDNASAGLIPPQVSTMTRLSSLYAKWNIVLSVGWMLLNHGLVCLSLMFSTAEGRRTRPTLNKTCDQHSINWLRFAAYRHDSLDDVDICDGLLPVDKNLNGKIQTKLKLKPLEKVPHDQYSKTHDQH